MEQKTSFKAKTARAILSELYDWSESIIAALVAVIMVLTFVVRATVVDGNSMLPTLTDSQFLALSRIYGSLQHNDIVVIYAKNIEAERGVFGKPIIKRIVGLPGDTINIDFDEGVVYRNGEALPQEVSDGFIHEDGHLINDYTKRRLSMEGEVAVPENSVFVMGDNRNDSLDSRDSAVGMVDMNYIVGKVLFRLTPFNKFGAVR